MLRRLALVAPLLAVTALVAGCSGASDKATEKSIEKSIEDATSQDADVNVDGDKVKVETSDGTFEAGGNKLPDGYPADDVPVVDGKILFTAAANEGFSVTVQYDGTPAEAIAAAKQALTAAGMDEQKDVPVIGDHGGLFTGHGYGVVISADDSTGGTVIAYIVTPE